MNRAVLLLLIALALAPLAQAQEEFSFGEDYYVRVAVGDIPTTPATEAAGALNVAEYLKLQHNGTQTQVTYDAETAGDDVRVVCDCGSASRTGSTITIGSDVEAGTIRVGLIHSHPFEATATLALALDAMGDDHAVVFLLAPDHAVAASAKPSVTLPGTDDFDGTITQYNAVADWFLVHPADAPVYADAKTVEVPVGPDAGIDLLSILIGLAAGIGIWYLLVKQGMVQKRRRQEIAVAAHREVAGRDPKPILEGRKRLLMTALKDLEMARMNKEIGDEAYDALKSEFKKQTVTTMRAIEESS